MSKLQEELEQRLKAHLTDNPCRGFVVGMTPDRTPVQISWIMGRSSPSQNRNYLVHDNLMEAKVADPSKVDAWLIPLIEYNAMRSYNDVHVVTNGSQTDTAIDAIKAGVESASLPHPQMFFKALETRYCEPDPTIFTSRISAYQDSRSPFAASLSIIRAEPGAKAHWIQTEAEAKAQGLKKEDFASTTLYQDEIDKRARLDRNKFPSVRDSFVLLVEPGMGYMLTTYMPGSKTLPPFSGEPLVVPIQRTLEESMQYFWNALESQWRVAVGGREVSRGHIRYATPIEKAKADGQ